MRYSLMLIKGEQSDKKRLCWLVDCVDMKCERYRNIYTYNNIVWTREHTIHCKCNENDDSIRIAI